MGNDFWVTISINVYMSDRPMMMMMQDASDDRIGQLDPLAA
jgi:hypothetical protein